MQAVVRRGECRLDDLPASVPLREAAGELVGRAVEFATVEVALRPRPAAHSCFVAVDSDRHAGRVERNGRGSVGSTRSASRRCFLTRPPHKLKSSARAAVARSHVALEVRSDVFKLGGKHLALGRRGWLCRAGARAESFSRVCRRGRTLSRGRVHVLFTSSATEAIQLFTSPLCRRGLRKQFRRSPIRALARKHLSQSKSHKTPPCTTRPFKGTDLSRLN